MMRSRGRDGLWTTGGFSTGSQVVPLPLWEAGEGGGMAAAPLTCGDVGLSTIHNTYYCS